MALDVQSLKTRISLKYDTLQNWTNSTLVLRAGEVAFCVIPANASSGYREPSVMFKVGDGTHVFSELPWASALSADTIAEARSKATLDASINTLIGRTTASSSKTYDDIVADLAALTGGTTGSIASQIEEAINGLLGTAGDTAGASTVYGAKAYADSLASNYDAAGSASTAEQNAKDYADGLASNYDATGAADTAEQNAKDYADSLASNYDAAGAAAAVLGATGNTAGANTVYGAKAYADSLASNYDAAGAAATAEQNAKDYADGLASNYDAAGAAAAVLGTSGDTAGAQTVYGAKAYADAAIAGITGTYAAKSYESKVDTLVGSDTGKSVRTIANEELAAQLIPANANESLDTLQEIAAWIQAHPADASAMNSAISALEGIVGDNTAGLVKDVADLQAVGATKVESSNTNGNIKIDGVETTVYTEVANTVHDANYAHITVTTGSVSDGTHTFAQYDDTALAGRVSTLEGVGATKVEASSTNGNIKIDGVETTVYTAPSGSVVDASYVHTDNNYTTTEKTKLAGISAGANKVEASTTNGNIKVDGTEVNVYTAPTGSVVDANYAHITVTTGSVSDGTTTFTKYDDTALAGRVTAIETYLNGTNGEFIIDCGGAQ